MPAFLLRSDVPPAQIRGIVGRLDARATVTIAPLADTLRQALRDAYTGVTVSWMLGALALVLAVGGVFRAFSAISSKNASGRSAFASRSSHGAPRSSPRCSAAHAPRWSLDYPSPRFSRLPPARRFADFSTA